MFLDNYHRSSKINLLFSSNNNNNNNNNDNFIYIALKSNNCPKRYLIKKKNKKKKKIAIEKALSPYVFNLLLGTTKYSLHEERNDLEYVLKFKRSEI